jgi:acyl-CoA synthetase (AMP-forming)/AMP-acid ligase II
VEIAGQDGRACMVAINMVPGAPAIDFTDFQAHIKKNLPPYSWPTFVRLLAEMETTGTFKHQKVALRNQGHDPSQVDGDRMLWYNGASKQFEEYDQSAYDMVQGGKARL